MQMMHYFENASCGCGCCTSSEGVVGCGRRGRASAQMMHFGYTTLDLEGWEYKSIGAIDTPLLRAGMREGV